MMCPAEIEITRLLRLVGQVWDPVNLVLTTPARVAIVTQAAHVPIVGPQSLT